jgi:hypothetical protein
VKPALGALDFRRNRACVIVPVIDHAVTGRH